VSTQSTSATKPIIGITPGDPAGIGPEITAKALATLSAEKRKRILVFANPCILGHWWDEALPLPAHVHCDELLVHIEAKEITPGKPNAKTALAQVAYLQAALKAAQAGVIAGIVTAPIHKGQAHSAGFSFPGHTEFFGEGLGARNVAMMFAGPRLKVVLATIHEPLLALRDTLTAKRIEIAIVLAAQAMREDFGHSLPRIGVLGLNPHAGEGGKFGDEEARIIKPAIASASEQLADKAIIEGPLVPDAAFRMPYDCFVAMYHDQGLIAVKLIDFDQSVNVTLGLPIVRTSPDHGVAYDIAGRGIARSTSMYAAISLAFGLVDQRETKRPIVS